MAKQFDIIIQNGTITDGSGNSSFQSDIGIIDDKIDTVSPRLDPANATSVIDAGGLVVSPGFIDTHAHDDFYLLIKPTADDKVGQGVTTVVTGNCGFSIAPLLHDKETFIRKVMSILGGDIVSEDILQIESFSDLLDKTASAKPGINVAPLVGHVNARYALLGLENRAPDHRELNRMSGIVEEAMEQGAFGLSTGLIYPPGNYTKTDEIIELAKIVSRHGGIYTTHLRSESNGLVQSLAEAIEIGKKADIPVHISHHKAAGTNNWGQSAVTLKMMADARKSGMKVTCDQYPYSAGSTFLGALVPPEYLSQGPEAMPLIFNDMKTRQEVMDKIEAATDTGENFIKAAGFNNIFIATAPKHPECVGKSISQIAVSTNRTDFEVMFDLLAAEKMDATVVMFIMDEQDIENILKDPFTMIGSDGISDFGKARPHPRQFGTFPKIFKKYVRQKQILSLVEAVRKMTSLPARTFNLKKKGLLKAGYDADMVIFNPDTIADQSTYEVPDQKPAGIHYVLVNGKIAARNGTVTGKASGKVLKNRP